METALGVTAYGLVAKFYGAGKREPSQHEGRDAPAKTSGSRRSCQVVLAQSVGTAQDRTFCLFILAITWPHCKETLTADQSIECASGSSARRRRPKMPWQMSRRRLLAAARRLSPNKTVWGARIISDRRTG
jgi:hypothetical protein